MAGRSKGSRGSAAKSEAGERGKIYYRIGEVARITEVKPYVLRYWESEFRWMAPGKSKSNQRLYRQRDIETIQLIKKLLYQERYTIAGARKRLRELGIGGAADAAEPSEPTHDHAANYRRVREELESLRALL